MSKYNFVMPVINCCLQNVITEVYKKIFCYNIVHLFTVLKFFFMWPRSMPEKKSRARDKFRSDYNITDLINSLQI